MISIDVREPILIKDSKRKKSPRTSPIKPETESHIQLCEEASVGTAMSLKKKVNTLNNIRAKNKRIKFTAKEPTFLLADSKVSAVAVQKKTVNNAANSPRCDLNIIMKMFAYDSY